jgi:hypothetical protein
MCMCICFATVCSYKECICDIVQEQYCNLVFRAQEFCRPSSFVLLLSILRRHLKSLLSAEEPRHQPIKESPQLAYVVLNGGPAEDDSMRCHQCPTCLSHHSSMYVRQAVRPHSIPVRQQQHVCQTIIVCMLNHNSMHVRPQQHVCQTTTACV